MSTTTTTPAVVAHPRLALAACLVSSSLTHLEATMMVVALPSIRADLGATDAQLQWMAAGYLLAFALVLLLAGRLGDVVGRRSMYVLGQSVFLIAALAAVTADSAEVVVVARVVQGLGAGLLLPQGSAMIQTLFTGAGRARAFGLLGVSISIATASGPLIAGALIALGHGNGAWRWLYAVTVPLSVGVLVAALLVLPGRDGPRDWRRLDLLGALLAGTGLAALLWPLVGTGRDQPRPWWTLAVAVPVLGLLAVQQRRRAPGVGIIERSVLLLPHYRPGVAVSSLFFAGSTAVPAVLAVVLQERHAYSALLAGIATIPWSLGNAVAAPVAARRVMAAGRTVVAVGAGVTTVALLGLVGVLLLEPAPLPVWVGLVMLVGGAGAGSCIGPNLSVTLAHVPREQAGGASALMQTGQRLGAAAGTAVALAVLFGGSTEGASTSAAAVAVAAALVAGACVVATLTRGQRPETSASTSSQPA